MNKKKTTPDQIHYLQHQTFSENEPSTLLRDFSSLLDFIGTDGIPVSGKNHLIATKLLPPLNQLMSHPLELTLKRPQQKSFPQLNGLYLLLRASGLTQIAFEKKEARLRLDKKVFANWISLNPTERYFTLLHTWRLRGRDNILESGSGYENGLNRSLLFFHYELNGGISLKEKPNALDDIKYSPGFHNIALMELFGFIRIEQDRALSLENWPIVNIFPTTWGHTLLNNFSEHTNRFYKHFKDKSDEEMIASWRSELKTYIPALEKDLKQPEPEKIPDSLYIFKVALGPIYRKIAAPGFIDLEWLACSILSAFKFDNDHLHEFVYKNCYGITERVVHSYMNSNEPYTSDCIIDDLPLHKGMELTFHFDFGDDWLFQLVVESIESNDPKYSEPTIIEQKGTPPRQYSY